MQIKAKMLQLQDGGPSGGSVSLPALGGDHRPQAGALAAGCVLTGARSGRPGKVATSAELC